jgi:hypothetical protein
MGQGSSRILLMHFWIYPNMLQQVIAIIRGPWFPQKLLKLSVLWMCMDCGPSRQLWMGRNPYTSTIQTAWVVSEKTTTPWWWQWPAETCWGKSRNALIKSCYFLDAFVGCFITILQGCSVQLSRYNYVFLK